MSRTVALIAGDGIGPEVTEAAVRVVAASGAALEWDRQEAGLAALERDGRPLPRAVLDAVLLHGVALKGPITTPVGRGFRSVNVELRQALDLYASLRPVRSLPGLPTRYPDLDLVVVRENTEGMYSGLEHQVVEGVVESLKIITRKASTRIARFAFEYARANGRGTVTAVHKANIMKLSDGLFLDCCREVAEEWPEIGFQDRIIDALCMQLVMHPEAFDVLVLPNLYGDIVSDLTAGLTGGLGLAPGANIGEQAAVFEAVHGSAPDIAGQGVANPVGLIRSAVLMLLHLGESEAARRIEDSLVEVVGTRGVRTRDLGGEAGTVELTDALVQAVESR